MSFGQYRIDDVLMELEDDKSIALFTGSGTDITDCYPDGYKQNDDIKHNKLTWDGVLNELIKYASVGEVEKNVLEKMSSDLQAAILKDRLGSSYIPIIQNWLYSRCNRKLLEDSFDSYDSYRNGQKELDKVPFGSLFALAEIILLQNSIRAVITQNYNCFLTDAIKILIEHNKGKRFPYRNIQPIDVYDGWREEKFVENVFMIYHVHGYIPPASAIQPRPESNHIVLSQEEFHELSKNVFSWQNTTQLHFLTHHTCLFIGLSLNDMTTLRMLRHANLEKSSERVYSLMAATKHDEKERVEIMMKMRYFESQHLHLVFEPNGYPFVYHRLRTTALKHRMEKLNKKSNG